MNLPHFPKELEAYYNRLEERDGLFTRFPRKEKNVLEVCRTVGGILANGLTSFWDTSGINQRRAIAAFREIGCEEIANALQESNWVKKILARGVTEPDGQYKFTEPEEKEFDAIEKRAVDRFQDALNRASEYMREHRLG